jgi:hypothetical protein
MYTPSLKNQSVFGIAFLLLLLAGKANAQYIIYIKGENKIEAIKVKEMPEQYSFTYLSASLKKEKSSILKTLVDSVVKVQAKPETLTAAVDSAGNAIPPLTKKQQRKKDKELAEANNAALATTTEKPWIKTVAFGLNIGNVLEFNNPTGTNDKSFSLNSSLDLGANYKRTGKRIESSNELHFTLGMQKKGLTSSAPIQNVTDNLNTLHDFSIGMGKKNKINFNLITKFTTSVFTKYDGNYFKDINNLGKIQQFLSPYELTLAPGIKIQPDKYLRLSLSPYSVRLYGVKDASIATKGIFITDRDIHGNYKQFLYKRLGAAINIWYDRTIGDWLQIQYRVDVSSDYFEKIGKNGLLNGQFYTRFKLLKNVYLDHRATLTGDFSMPVFKPFYSQTIMLCFNKTF